MVFLELFSKLKVKICYLNFDYFIYLYLLCTIWLVVKYNQQIGFTISLVISSIHTVNSKIQRKTNCR